MFPRMSHFCKWTYLLGHIFYICIVMSCFPGLPNPAKVHFLGETCFQRKTNLHFMCPPWPFSKLISAFSWSMLMTGLYVGNNFLGSQLLEQWGHSVLIIVSAGPDNLVMFELWNYSQHSSPQVLHLWIETTQNKNIGKNYRMYADVSLLSSFQDHWL